jgi:hypothetical protein
MEVGAPFPGALGRPSTYVEDKPSFSLPEIEEKPSVQAVKSVGFVKKTKKFVSKNDTRKAIPVTFTGGPSPAELIKVVHKPRFPKKSGKNTEDVNKSSNEKESDGSDSEEEELFAPKHVSSDREIKKKAAISSQSKIFIPRSKRTLVDDYHTHKASVTSKRTSIELECKFIEVKQYEYASLLLRYPGVQISSVDYIKDDVRKTEYIKDYGKEVEYMKKNSIGYKVEGSFRFTLKSETMITQNECKGDFSVSSVELRRSKTRSRSIVGNGKYYLDLTSVKSDEMIAGKKRSRDSYEIEAEIIPDLDYELIPTYEEFLDFVTELRNSITVDETQKEIFSVLKSGYSDISKILTKVGQLSPSFYYSEFYDKISDGFYVTEKLDGRRGLIYVDKGVEYLYEYPFNLVSTRKVDVEGTFILDCEIYEDSPFVIDVVHPKVSKNIMKRLSELPEFYAKISKIYYLVESVEELEQYVDLLYENNNRKVDGLLFVTSGVSYSMTKVYKWKPHSQQTVDFYLHLEDKKNGVYNYILCSGISTDNIENLGLIRNPKLGSTRISDDYVLIQFSPTYDPYAYKFSSDESDLNGRIFEMIRDGKQWTIVRERKDKGSPNDFKVAESVFGSYIENFNVEMLTAKTGYFPSAAVKKDSYKEYLGVIRNISARYLYKGASTCIDLGAGRGGDIHNYRKFGLSKVLCIESDRNAILELCSRRYFSSPSVTKRTLIYSAFAKVGKDDIRKIAIDYDIDTVDAVTSNFSAHYFMKSKRRMEKILKQIYLVLKYNGRFTIISLDDTKVTEDYESKDKRFRIEYLEGGSINVLMPFSGDMMEETLINSSLLKEAADACGFNFRRENLDLSRVNLSEVDKEYIQKHCVYTLTKKS